LTLRCHAARAVSSTAMRRRAMRFSTSRISASIFFMRILTLELAQERRERQLVQHALHPPDDCAGGDYIEDRSERDGKAPGDALLERPDDKCRDAAHPGGHH